MSRSHRIFPILTAAVAILLALQLTARAQESGDQTSEADDYSSQETSSLKQRVSVDSPAGITVGEYIDNLRGKTPGLNIITSESANSFRLPKIQLQKVAAESALFCLEQLSNRKILIEQDEIGESIVYIKLNDQYRSDIVVHVMNIEHLLSHKSEKQLLSAIEIGLEMMNGNSTDVQLKLHSESKLLFAKGEHREVNLIENIIDEMRKSVRQLPSKNGAPGIPGGTAPSAK